MADVAVYVDGFNVYFGLKALMSKRQRACYKWLDYWALGEGLVQSSPHAATGDKLVSVKYFSALVEDDRNKAGKHAAYIEALKSRGVEVILGRYYTQIETCRNPSCSYTWRRGEEKQSDVAIGIHMLADAYKGMYQKAILVTGDSDQVPTIKAVRKAFPGRSVVLAYPPERSRNNDLESVLESGATMRFNKWLAQCQLPAAIKVNGKLIRCPEEWR
ncbi:MAG: NYN domain-containing protein [Planctomycetales bacterium]|nr:NYN domain-containing protein [bacterium]UNM09498.1 MAG: NYN domain-containing protein [Planctomycetales bacterium]